MLSRGLIGSVLVLLGGLVVSTLPESAALMQFHILQELRGHGAGRMLGLAFVMLGLGMLGAAWLALCRYVSHEKNNVEPDEALSLVRHATLVWSAPLLLAPPLFSRDGWSYAAQGMLTRLDVSPYTHGPGVLQGGPIIEAVDPRWLFTPTPYGPLPLILGDLAAQGTGNPWLLVVIHRLIALVGLALLAWAVPRLAQWTGMNPALATAIVIASPLMLANGVGGLHNDLLMVGLMASALVVAVERSWFWGAVLGGAAAAVKLPGGLVCIGVALVTLPLAATMLERVRRLALVGVVAVGFLVGLGVLWGLGIGWADALSVPGTVNTPLSVPTLIGGALDWTAEGLNTGLAPATFLDVVRKVAQVASVLAAAYIALRWRTGDKEASLQAVATVVGTTLLMSPVVHLWYFLWLVPFVAPLRLSRVGTTTVIAVSVIIGLVAPLDSSLHGAYLAILLTSMLAAVVFGALLLTRSARNRIERIADADWLPV
ncbi:polyprenol phosphomannose-dependent alpha 1,6 mannosyltransferase MptB [Nocardioides speluncae]|uniref:polyprenol phosphomannose-dependent alpha 1,6 mannosyltransferase MptB n=1 Tax=Nocardioides speluncae TaxID=2670337 RepID=UPI001F0C8453|nr:polyprenol phosphomannose-dependent alpha 1,6 mannosyltransferase MptB [Nocardioides speluncae]